MWGRPLAITATVGGFQVDGLTSLSVQLVVRAGGEREREREDRHRQQVLVGSSLAIAATVGGFQVAQTA